MNSPVKFAACLLVGVAVGTISARYLVSENNSFFATTSGYWQSWPVTSDTDRNPYILARFTSKGQLPEHLSEIISFYRDRNDEGDGLSYDCSYLITFKPPTARRWSISLVDAPDTAKSLLTQDYVIAGPDLITIRMAARPQPGNWLQMTDDADPVVRFRLYDGDSIIAQDDQNSLGLNLPSIKTEACA